MATKNKKKTKEAKRKRGQKSKSKLTAATADRHELYESSVQAVDAEIDFVDTTFTALRDREAVYLREDFCGTGNTSCEWVRRRKSNYAVGVDLDASVMAWGREHHIDNLEDSAKERIKLVQANVLEVDTQAQDIVLAMNFSYWIFQQREMMREYFERVRRTLSADGVFFLDCFGGSEAFCELRERTTYKHYTYVWDQAAYNPITGEMKCHIHFKFPDGTKLKKAFTYEWRLWTLPEIRELLSEAGFSRVSVYWQGWDDDEEDGNGEFLPVENADADAGWLCYVVAEK